MAGQTVILAAGDFPRKGTCARQLLESAAHIVCCDSAADAYRRHFGREPTVVIGDCDSVRGKFSHVVRVTEQETNDLEKAIRHCATLRWRNPILLGVMGKREDHAIGNLFRGMEHGLEIVTDRGRFLPVKGRLTLTVAVGTAISVFAPPGTAMTSRGLAWKLDGVAFRNFYCATLNRAAAKRIVVTADGPAYIYVG